MSNIITTNPMRFDGVTTDAENAQLAGSKYIEKVEWTGNSGRALSATHSMEVTDANSVIKYEKYAAYDGDDYGSGRLNPPDVLNGIKVTKLGGGILRIWLTPLSRG